MEKGDMVKVINPESVLEGKIGEVIEIKAGAISLLKVLIDGRVFTFSEIEIEIMKVNTGKGRGEK